MKPSDVNPSLPVIGASDKAALAASGDAFDIVRIGQFRSPKYGPTWRVTISGAVAGHILFAANDVRDDVLGAMRDALAEHGEPIGPCKLMRRKLDSGRETWEIVDWDDAPESARPR